MPPTTKQILDGLEEMQKAPIAVGWRSIALSAADEIRRLRKRADNLSKLNHHRAKLLEELRRPGQIAKKPADR